MARGMRLVAGTGWWEGRSTGTRELRVVTLNNQSNVPDTYKIDQIKGRLAIDVSKHPKKRPVTGNLLLVRFINIAPLDSVCLSCLYTLQHANFLFKLNLFCTLRSKDQI